MKYVSTRGKVEPVGFEAALLQGQAADGGLFLPCSFPNVEPQWEDLRQYSFTDLAYHILSLYATDIESNTLKNILSESFAQFDDAEVAPLVCMGDLNILELFHGPTLAFKDIALQVIGRLFEHVLSKRSQFMNVIGATSGDTGSAAIAGVRGRKGLSVFIMFPDGRTSPLQERQMTTVMEDNVHCLAIDGSFDDCQHILKSIFNDVGFKQKANLGAVNSINWARIMVQVVYYIYATLRFKEPVTFSVPTGNFGNILSAVIAKYMGAPIRQLILGTNENDILTRFFGSGQYQRGQVHQTLSPSMDIQVASNLERFLYLYLKGDAVRLRTFMETFTSDGQARLENAGRVDPSIEARRIDTQTTLETIRQVWEQYDYVLDPHSAVGVAASREAVTEGPTVNLATAHPAKFPDAVRQANSSINPTHARLDRLQDLPTRKIRLPNSISAVRSYLEEHTILKAS